MTLLLSTRHLQHPKPNPQSSTLNPNLLGKRHCLLGSNLSESHLHDLSCIDRGLRLLGSDPKVLRIYGWSSTDFGVLGLVTGVEGLGVRV